MILKRYNSNYKLLLKKFGEKIEITTASFYSEKPIEDILNHLNERIKIPEGDKCDIEIVFSKINTKISFKKIFPYRNIELKFIKEEILSEIYELDKTFDIKKNRFSIVVMNKLSPQYDDKCFTFNSFEDINLIYKKLKIFFEGESERICNSDIEFSNQLRDVTTHYIKLYPAGTKTENDNFFSFSICIPNYSSKEIIKILKGENNGD